MADTTVQALAFGEILFDVYEDGAYLGGAPLNFAWYLRQFGIRAGMISAVGHDSLGEQAQATLRQADVDLTYVTCMDAPTGTVDVTLTNGQPRYVINEGVAWDNITLNALPQQTPPLIYFGTLAQRTTSNRTMLNRLLGTAPAHRFFDINLRQHYYSDAILLESLKQSTLVKLNEDEWSVLSRVIGVVEPVQVVQRYGLQALVLTRGERGASLYRPTGETHAASPKVTVVDAVGAGDAFSAVMAAAAIRGYPLDRALQVACEVGAYVVTVRGAQTTLPASLRDAIGMRD
jgi:fructokinase